jgi:hypothetical protein
MLRPYFIGQARSLIRAFAECFVPGRGSANLKSKIYNLKSKIFIGLFSKEEVASNDC